MLSLSARLVANRDYVRIVLTMCGRKKSQIKNSMDELMNLLVQRYDTPRTFCLGRVKYPG